MSGGVLTAQGGATWTQHGFSGGGLLLPPGGSSLTGAPPLPLGNSPYTVVAMLQTSTPCVACGVVGWGGWGTTGGVTALRLEGGSLRGWWWDNDLVALVADGVGLADGGWHQVAFMYDGTVRSLYVDGLVVAADVPGGVHNATAGSFGIGVK